MINTRSFIVILAVLASLTTLSERAIAEEDSSPFITEAYYRVKWGHFEEFMELFKKNHFPILKALQEQGVVESMEAVFPVNHASEESRWDFRLTITMPDPARMGREFPKVSKKLFPDQEKLARDERHRFSLLKAHKDVTITRDDLSKW